MLTVKLFARARDLAGSDSLPVRLPEGRTVAELRKVLYEVCPALKSFSSGLLVAVNASYARDTTVLSAGDEVACFPPVSGG